jgi:hypothetical protein
MFALAVSPLLVALAAAPVSVPASVTNTEAVHDLAAFQGKVVACTEGGLDVFSANGKHLRTLHREDGVPSHFCRALRVEGSRLFAATDEGVAEIDARWKVRAVLPFQWAALPEFDGSDATLRAWAKRLPQGPRYTAFSKGFAGTADGRVIRLADQRVWSVPGPVRLLDERGDGLRIGTAEGRFLLTPAGLAVEPRVGLAPFAYSGHGQELEVLTANGERFRWSEEPLEDKAPRRPSSWLTAYGKTWAGTAHGAFTLEPAGWVQRTLGHQLCGNHVTALARFQGRLVVGTFDAGVCWQDASGRWTSFHVPALPSDHVTALAAEGRRLYVATEYGLGVWDGRRWTQLGKGGRNPLGFEKLTVLAASAPGSKALAFADGRGVSFLQDGRFDHRLPLPASWANHPSVASASGRYVWYGSEDRGLARFDGSSWTHFHDGRDLTDNWITAIDADAAGRVIAGTCQEGFNYFDGTRWTRVRNAPALATQDVTAVALTPEGAVIGTLLGAARFNAASGEVTRLPTMADPRISAIWSEPGRVWFGTEGGLSSLPSEAVGVPAATARR